MNNRYNYGRMMQIALIIFVMNILCMQLAFAASIQTTEIIDDMAAADSAVAVSGIRDGKYNADWVGWSGGSGRLSYIRCNDIEVKSGVAYAKLEFGSPNYDLLRIGGKEYRNEGTGNSIFTVPVKVNSNFEFTARTTAMSAPHWIDYSMHIRIAEGDKCGTEGSRNTVSCEAFNENIPELPGLTAVSADKNEDAKLFRMFNYENNIKLLQIDMSTRSVLKYDDKDRSLYHKRIVSYLIAPKDVELPAGLEKEIIVLRTPSKNVVNVNLPDDIDYGKLVRDKSDIVVISNKAIRKFLFLRLGNQESVDAASEKLDTLGVSMIIDRSGAEHGSAAKDEWSKVWKLIK